MCFELFQRRKVHFHMFLNIFTVPRAMAFSTGVEGGKKKNGHAALFRGKTTPRKTNDMSAAASAAAAAAAAATASSNLPWFVQEVCVCVCVCVCVGEFGFFPCFFLSPKKKKKGGEVPSNITGAARFAHRHHHNK